MNLQRHPPVANVGKSSVLSCSLFLYCFAVFFFAGFPQQCQVQVQESREKAGKARRGLHVSKAALGWHQAGASTKQARRQQTEQEEEGEGNGGGSKKQLTWKERQARLEAEGSPQRVCRETRGKAKRVSRKRDEACKQRQEPGKQKTQRKQEDSQAKEKSQEAWRRRGDGRAWEEQGASGKEEVAARKRSKQSQTTEEHAGEAGSTSSNKAEHRTNS